MKSKDQREKLWKEALAKGVCPFAGCDIRKETCHHLDRYLTMNNKNYINASGQQVPSIHGREVKLSYVDWIDEKPGEKEPESGQVWALFKKLRAFGLQNDQVAILIRRFAYGMTFKQIYDEMHWVSMGTLHKRYKHAVDKIKREGGL